MEGKIIVTIFGLLGLLLGFGILFGISVISDSKTINSIGQTIGDSINSVQDSLGNQQTEKVIEQTESGFNSFLLVPVSLIIISFLLFLGGIISIGFEVFSDNSNSGQL